MNLLLKTFQILLGALFFPLPGPNLALAASIAFNTANSINIGIGTSNPQGAFTVINGNVGIGTWSPSSLLEAGAQKVDIANSGNVGIGTMAPTGKLEIEGGNVGINTASTTSNALTVFGGNVGIGTTTAPNMLYVAGTAQVRGFKLSNGATSGYVLQSDAGGNGSWVSPLGNVGVGTINVGTINNVAYYSGAIQLSGSNNFNFDGNNVGIGTTVMKDRLDIVGNLGIGTQSGDLFLTAAPPNGGMIVEGNVGISSSLPVALLDLSGGVSIITSDKTMARFTVDASGTENAAVVLNNTNGTDWKNAIDFEDRGNLKWQIGNDYNANGSQTFFIKDGVAGQVRLFIDPNGNIGVSSTVPGQLLDINGGNATVAGTGKLIWGSDNKVFIQASAATGAALEFKTNNTEVMRIVKAGNVGIGTTTPLGILTVLGGNVGIGTWAPNARLIVQGGNVGIGTANANYNLQIGGCTTVTGTTSCVDLAELIPSSEPVGPGDLLMLDPRRPVTVRKAVDRGLLFGVVSTDPAIVIEGPSVGIINGMGFKQDPMKPAVALAGRVPVKVSLENGPITIGDMIRASSVPGIGAKAVGPGRVVGMALEPLDDLGRKPYQSIMVYINPHWWKDASYVDERTARLKAQDMQEDKRLKRLERMFQKIPSP